MFKNEWLLDVDLKFKYSSLIPVFRRGDTAILKFRFHDNGGMYDISAYDKAEITIIMPSGVTLKEKCDSEDIDGIHIIKFQFKSIHMIEIGTYDIILTLSKSNNRISVQPIKVRFFDNLSNTNLSFLQLIQDLQVQINDLDGILDNAVMNSEKGKPNGVASLNADGKIPDNQIPNFMTEHVNKKVYLEGVHGFKVNEQGLGMYETPDGQWKYIEFSDTATGNDTRLKLSTTVVNGVVTLEYTGNGYPTLQKWMIGSKAITDFASNGTTFTGLTFNVTSTGIHTIYYKDELGNEYVHKLDVAQNQLKEPNVAIDVNNGVVTITIDQSTSQIKWDKGTRDVTYFQSNGYKIAENSFTVDEVGTYTLYYKITSGLEYVKVFTVSESSFNYAYIPDLELRKKLNQLLGKGSISNQLTMEEMKSIIDFDAVGLGKISDLTGMELLTNCNRIRFSPITLSGDQIFFTDMSPLLKLGENKTLVELDIYAVENDKISIFNQLKGKFPHIKTGGVYTNGHEDILITLDELQGVDKTAPIIALTQSPTSNTKGDVTVSISATDASGISIVKWASGNQTTSYFNSNGTITTNSFIVTSNGIYTVYAKDNFGNETVKIITISNINKDTTPPVFEELYVRDNLDTKGYFGYKVVDADSPIVKLKHAKGSQTISYFANNGWDLSVNGTKTIPNPPLYNAPQFHENGVHTFYAKDASGNEVIKTINATLPAGILINHWGGLNSGNLYAHVPTKGGILSVSIVKWDYGIKDITYFSSSGNTDVTFLRKNEPSLYEEYNIPAYYLNPSSTGDYKHVTAYVKFSDNTSYIVKYTAY